MSGRNSITAKQMALLTFITQTGLGVIVFPSVLAKEVGHDGWISVLLGGLVALIFSGIFALLLRRYQDKGIYDINQLIFGKILGTSLNCLLVVYLVLAAARGIRIFTLFLKLTVLPLSPPIIVSPFILLPSVYLVWQGLKYVTRFKYISALSYIFAFLLVALMMDDIRISFLEPIGEAGLVKIIASVKTSFLAYTGLELIVFLFPEITDKDQAFKWHVIANLLSTLFFLVIIIANTAIFGASFLEVQTLPLFNLARAYNAPILERVDLYMISLWFVVMGCSMRAYMFTAYYSLHKVCKLKRTHLTLGIYFLCLVLISRIPRDINEAFIFLDVINYIGTGVALFFLFCLCCSFLRKKGVRVS